MAYDGKLETTKRNYKFQYTHTELRKKITKQLKETTSRVAIRGIRYVLAYGNN